MRKHSVIVDGVSSDVGRVRSGVPQGSVLGPLLFIIAIVDIDASLTSATASSFADDTRISMQMSRHQDSKVLQDELNRIYDWAELNKMVFNDSKFEHLEYTTHLPYEVHRSFNAKNGDPIQKTEVIKDLGVLMSADCCFKEQIQSMVKKANVRLGGSLERLVAVTPSA